MAEDASSSDSSMLSYVYDDSEMVEDTTAVIENQ